jgi:hypothetical protein
MISSLSVSSINTFILFSFPEEPFGLPYVYNYMTCHIICQLKIGRKMGLNGSFDVPVDVPDDVPANKKGQKNASDLVLFYGSPGRIRTYNPPVNSRMLCR